MIASFSSFFGVCGGVVMGGASVETKFQSVDQTTLKLRHPYMTASRILGN